MADDFHCRQNNSQGKETANFKCMMDWADNQDYSEKNIDTRYK